MQSKTKVIVALSVVVLILVSVFSIRTLRKPVEVRLVGDVPASCIKGEKFEVKGQLVNPSFFGARIVRLHMMCGCSTAGRPLRDLLLGSYETLDVTFSVDSAKKKGIVNFGGLIYSKDLFGSVHASRFAIPVNVRPPWYLSENQVYLTEADQEGEVFRDSLWLYDHQDGDFLEVEKVVSQLEGFDAEIIELTPGSAKFEQCEQFLTKRMKAQHGLRPRYQVSFKWRPGNEMGKLENRVDIYVKDLDCLPASFQVHLNRDKS